MPTSIITCTKATVLFLLLFATRLSAQTGTIIYVDSSVSISGNGSGWTTAFKTLAPALSLANAGNGSTQIWVAKGTYYPTAGNSRDSSFRIVRNNVKLYGGFSPGGSSFAARNYQIYSTILSGNIGNPDSINDNSFHVMTIVTPPNSGIDAATLVDGFTIQAGNANEYSRLNLNGLSYDRQNGGGIFNSDQSGGYGCSPTYSHCIFLSNNSSGGGGAMYAGGTDNGRSTPVITHCTFTGNSAAIGGALQNDGSGDENAFPFYTKISSPSIDNCVFSNNKAGSGGAIYNDGRSSGTCKPAISSCTFSGNSSSSAGGAMYNVGGGTYGGSCDPVVTNCIFIGNTSIGLGAAVATFQQDIVILYPVFLNCIFTANSSEGGVMTEFSGLANIRSVLTNCAFLNNNCGSFGAISLLASAFGRSTPVITNCTIAGTQGFALYDTDGASSLTNCILWNNTKGDWGGNNRNTRGNPTVKNSLTQGYGGGDPSNIISQNPRFFDSTRPAGADGIYSTADDGFQIITGSPAINKGDNNAITAGVMTDVAGSSRKVNGTVDMGAYESHVDYSLSASASVTRFCPTNGLTVAYAAAGYYTPDNAFTAQLSDASGGFSNPVVIGSVTAPQSGIINAVIPADIPAGTGYRIRVVSSIPQFAGTDNGSNMTIFSTPTKPPVTASGPLTFYTGGNVVLSATAGFASYRWSNNDTTGSITVNSSGSFAVKVTNASGCTSTASDTVTVTVQPRPVTLSVSHMDGDYGQLTNNNIRPYLQLNNESASAIPYSSITIRYWLTVENFSPMTNGVIDWAPIGTNKVKMKYVKLGQPRQGAYGYIEYSFDPSAGNLAAGSNSGPIQSRAGKQDWTNFNEADDHSYSASNSYIKNNKITVYQNGVLAGGTEPATIPAVQSLKAASQDVSNGTSTNTISNYLKLNNEGNTPVSYNDITLRYWFTAEGNQPLNYTLDYAQLGSSNIKYKFVKLSLAVATADTYLELGFAAADSLYPASSTGNIQQRIAKNNWSLFNQLNDHSYKAGSSMSENNRVTVYFKGMLVYGTEPGAASGLNHASPAQIKATGDQVAETGELKVRLLRNPVQNNRIGVEIRGAAGQQVRVQLIDMQGRLVSERMIGAAGAIEQQVLPAGSNASGILLMKVSTGTQSKTVQVLLEK